ncbi:MAG TPA: HAMP domain-containing sensor histidine kinase [Candidatus Lumbricidophila sp.]|nr:HAMP domain-containing sensor histidine kinase [Candidatus Lumbricidophila sp.]
MLSLTSVVLIGATTLVCTALVTTATLIMLRLSARRSLGARAAIVLAGALLSVGISTIAVATEMYLALHDVVVLGWVIGISAVMSMAATWVVIRRSSRASIASLVDDARRVGDGDIVDQASTGWRELDIVQAELAETSTRLAEAREQIAELDAARRQFFAWISHDLRTPLAGMSAMAEALDAGTAPDPAQYVRTIRSKVDTVTQMVDDLFELSKLQTGSLELRPEPVVLLDLVSDAVADVQALAAARGVSIEQDGVAGHVMLADPRELARAIGNLLANSLRHAPDHSTVLVRADQLEGGNLVLSVIDQGPGVAAEDLGRMFDVGWRADTARTHDAVGRTSAGAGLGLAIVRGIVEAHGGSVRAQRTNAGFQLDLVFPPTSLADARVSAP